MDHRGKYEEIARSREARQARESIKFISQISFLNSDGKDIVTSLGQEDAMNIFRSIRPAAGPRETDGNAEIQRLAALFEDGRNHGFFDHGSTIVLDQVESGFSEGGKTRRTHIAIERNPKLRSMFFSRTPTAVCDACAVDTRKRYPWVERVLDLHHVLPLSSGTRVDSKTGTVLDDLVPVCPTCHRAIHRFYDRHLDSVARQDFLNKREARDIYAAAKGEIARGDCHAR